MLVPAWLAGTVLGKGARNITAANAETGAFMRLAPAGKHLQTCCVSPSCSPAMLVLSSTASHGFLPLLAHSC